MTSKDESEKQFQTWVDSVHWKFSKTYAKHAPHEYTVTEWKPELGKTFTALAHFICERGQIDLYHGHPFTVYYLNGWKYWICDKDPDDATLINRTCEEWSVKFGLTWNPPAGFKIARDVEQAELQQFLNEVGSRMATEKAEATREETDSQVNPQELERFFSAVNQRLNQGERRDRRQASGFNVFYLIEPDENKLSDVLALLLDPKGVHGQGDLFLRLLIEQLDAGLSTQHTKNATVRREAPAQIEEYRRRIDVLVSADDMMVAIENKVDAAEQPEQVRDYLKYLRSHSVRNTLIYLTPNGRPPESLKEEVDQEKASNRLRCWCYGSELRAWLEECRKQCEAPRICEFISDFIQYIRLVLKREPKQDQEQGVYEH